MAVGGALTQACGSEGEAIPDAIDAGAKGDSGTPVPVQNATKAAATVGNTGGTVTTTTGVGVEIPAGALPNNVQVTVDASPSAATPVGATGLGTPHVFGPSGLQFSKPVTVVLEFDPTKLPAGKSASDIVVFTAPEGTTNYTPLPTKVRDATHVEAETTHFSVMVPTVPVAAIDAGTNPGTDDAGTCEARLCGFYGPGTCGTQSNGCGGSLNCGTCPTTGGDDAGTSQPDASVGGGDDAGTCQNPLTCANYEKAQGPICGDFDDGCGGKLRCESGCGAPDGGASDASTGGDPDAATPPAVCGDAQLTGVEQCDDGNTNPKDGCDGQCKLEPGFECQKPGLPCTPASSSDAGGGASDAGGGGASDASTPAMCGDGKLDASEMCDDGNTAAQDGCDSACGIEPGWTCPVPGQQCKPI